MAVYDALKPLLFALDPARAHALAMGALGAAEHVGALRALVRGGARNDPRLAVRALGLTFPSPVGLAGGFDKNAERARALAALGFGFLELGTVTAEAQAPNPPPNLFRLPEDRALVNRLGFPNQGAEVVAARVARVRAALGVPVAMSIGKSRSVPADDEAKVHADYLASYRAVRGVSDFVVVNVSSPNTKDLRSLQVGRAARALFEALATDGARACDARPPLLVKIAPDLDDAAVDAVATEAMGAGFAGVVATNTTIARTGLRTPSDVVAAIGAGGLSGAPLHARALAVVRRVRAAIGAGPCVIGVGGVSDGEGALAMLAAGADLVQLYTAFVYEGPGLPRAIAKDLLRRIEGGGHADLAALVAGARA